MSIWRYWRKYVGDGVCGHCGLGLFKLKTYTGIPGTEPVVLSLCEKCDNLVPRKM